MWVWKTGVICSLKVLVYGKKTLVLLSCSGFQRYVRVKAQPRVTASACAACAWGFLTPPGDYAHCPLSVLVFSFCSEFRTWANSTNVIQHSFMLPLMKFCIISPTQEKSPSPQGLRHVVLCTHVLSVCAVFLSASGFTLTQDLFMAWGTRFCCRNSPVPQPCPSMPFNIFMANWWSVPPTGVTPDLPFLETLVSSPNLPEI